MKKVITNKSTHYYYEKGDKVINIPTEEIFTVDSVDAEKKVIFTEEGTELFLSVDVRPTEETKINATVINKRKRRTYKKKVEATRTVQSFKNVKGGEVFTKKSPIDKIFFAKIKEDAIIPSKTIENACYDVYACFDEEEVAIKPNEIVMFGTGIATAFNVKFKAKVYERGSSGSVGMAVRSGVIDSGFRGEWFVPINNTTKKTIIISKRVEEVIQSEDKVIYPYKKAIAQFALEEVPKVLPITVSYEKLMTMKSERMTGKLGSSNK